MTAVETRDLRAVNSLEDVIDLYSCGPGRNQIGLETEHQLLKRESLSLIGHAENVAIERAVPRSTLEPGNHQIEIVSKPLSDPGSAIEELRGELAHLVKVAADNNVCVSPLPVNPHMTDKDHLNNIVETTADEPLRGDRQRTLIQLFQRQYPEAAAWPAKSTVLQVNLDRNEESRLKQGRRNLVANLVLMSVCENRPPFMAGGKHGGFHDRMPLHDVGKGLIPKLYTECSNDKELAQNEFELIMDTPMGVYYPNRVENRIAGEGEELQNGLEMLEEGETVTFRELCKRGYGTRANYMLARSMFWYGLKSKNLYDHQTGEAYHEIMEVRDLDTGTHQAATASLLLYAINFDAESRARFDKLLSKYGFGEDLEDTDMFNDAYHDSFYAAYNRQDSTYCGEDGSLFLHALFGKTGRTQLDFLREAMEQVIEPHYARYHDRPDIEAALEPLRNIAETGMTDAEFQRRNIPDIEAAERFIAEFDPALLSGPPKTQHMLYSEGRLSPQLFAAANMDSVVFMSRRHRHS